MDELLELVFIEGDILQTFSRILILFIGFDFLITFAGLIKSIKSTL